MHLIVFIINLDWRIEIQLIDFRFMMEFFWRVVGFKVTLKRSHWFCFTVIRLNNLNIWLILLLIPLFQITFLLFQMILEFFYYLSLIYFIRVFLNWTWKCFLQILSLRSDWGWFWFYTSSSWNCFKLHISTYSLRNWRWIRFSFEIGVILSLFW